MSKEDLIPVNTRPREEQIAICKKGGSTKSPRKKIAAKLREMRKKGLTNEASKKLYEMMTNEELSALDMLVFINSIKPVARNCYQKINLGKLMLDWHKLRHGEKLKTENMNFNVNVTIDEWERRLMEG